MKKKKAEIKFRKLSHHILLKLAIINTLAKIKDAVEQRKKRMMHDRWIRLIEIDEKKEHNRRASLEKEEHKRRASLEKKERKRQASILAKKYFDNYRSMRVTVTEYAAEAAEADTVEADAHANAADPEADAESARADEDKKSAMVYISYRSFQFRTEARNFFSSLLYKNKGLPQPHKTEADKHLFKKNAHLNRSELNDLIKKIHRVGWTEFECKRSIYLIEEIRSNILNGLWWLDVDEFARKIYCANQCHIRRLTSVKKLQPSLFDLFCYINMRQLKKLADLSQYLSGWPIIEFAHEQLQKVRLGEYISVLIFKPRIW